MPLNVLSVGYPLAPVSPGTAGGAEQILSILDEGIMSAGHDSIVIAPAGSQVCGTLLPTMPPGRHLDDARRAFAVAETRAAIRSAVRRFSVDLIHMHGVDFLEYLPDPGPPVVVSLHLPPGWYPPAVFRLQRPDTYLVCVSDSQRGECPEAASVYGVIPNGIRLPKGDVSLEKRDYVVALGRICPEKGFHIAADAAGRAGVPLVLAGTVFGYPAHQEYFANVLQPKLRGMHRFVGAIGGRCKEELLGRAQCLLIPSLVSETSSLVAMEALACGTPIVAFRRGALPEIVVDGETGYLVDTEEQMAEAIHRAGKLNPNHCREYAITHFSAQKMIDRYLNLYKALTATLATQKVA